jgi:hypothetical protein
VPLPSFNKRALIGIPLKREESRRPAAVLFQRQTPGHASDPNGEFADGSGRQRGKPEAKLCGARLHVTAKPQQKAGHTRLTGTQHAAPCGGKVERGLSQFADHAPETGAGERRLERPQGLVLRTDGDFDDAGRIEAKLDEARSIKTARFAARLRLTDPEESGSAFLSQTCQKSGEEAGRRPAFPALSGAHLMQGSKRKSPAQNGIERGDPKSE